MKKLSTFICVILLFSIYAFGQDTKEYVKSPFRICFEMI